MLPKIASVQGAQLRLSLPLFFPWTSLKKHEMRNYAAQGKGGEVEDKRFSFQQSM